MCIYFTFDYLVFMFLLIIVQFRVFLLFVSQEGFFIMQRVHVMQKNNLKSYMHVMRWSTLYTGIYSNYLYIFKNNKTNHFRAQLIDLYIYTIIHERLNYILFKQYAAKSHYLKVKPGCSICRQIFIGFLAKTRSTNMSIVELPPKAKST